MSSTRNQYYATVCVNFLGLSYGLSTGWTSAAIPLLQSEKTPLRGGQISDADASLIGSVLTIGGLCGTLFFGFASDKIGRKRSTTLIAFPQIVGWLLLYLAETSTLLVYFRFLSGFAAGGIFTIIPVFVSEISEDRVRGRLGSLLVLFFGLGLLLAYIFGAFLPYFLIPWVSIPCSVIFLFGFYHVPESPAFLAQTRRYEEAESSLRYYRGGGLHALDSSLDIKIELEAIMSSIDTNESPISCSDFKSNHARKALTYAIFLVALNQFCGCFAMLNFTGMIFEESGSTLSPNISSIIVGTIQVVGAVICTFSVERAGRKFLLAISSFGIALGLAVLSAYTFATSRGADLSSFSWIPLLSFSFVMFISNIGIFTLPFLYISEVVPNKLKAFTMALSLAALYVFATLVIQYLSTLIALLGFHGAMLLFSISSLIGALFIVLFLPETKGKSYEEISKLLEARR